MARLPESPMCLLAVRSAAACKRTRAVARVGGAATGADAHVTAGWDDEERSRRPSQTAAFVGGFDSLREGAGADVGGLPSRRGASGSLKPPLDSAGRRPSRERPFDRWRSCSACGCGSRRTGRSLFAAQAGCHRHDGDGDGERDGGVTARSHDLGVQLAAGHDHASDQVPARARSAAPTASVPASETPRHSSTRRRCS